MLCKKTISLILIKFISGTSAENKKWMSRKVMLKEDFKIFPKKMGFGWSVIKTR